MGDSETSDVEARASPRRRFATVYDAVAGELLPPTRYFVAGPTDRVLPQAGYQLATMYPCTPKRTTPMRQSENRD